MNTRGQFLDLLRLGLWGGAPDPRDFPAETDWKGIYRLSLQQTVIGLVFDALSQLPVALQPEVGLLRKWYVLVMKIEQSHHLLNRVLAEIVPMLRSEGINPVLLKGQGVAQNYRNPLRRQCGDIDLYVGEEQYDKACRLINGWGDVSGKELESLKHVHFRRNGVVIEVHRVAEHMYSPGRDRRFREWTGKHLTGTRRREWNVKDTPVLLPPVHFDALYIFNHIYHHFLAGGIGLRQLCDWSMYLSTFSADIDRDVLEKDLKAFGLMRPWKIFGLIAVRDLGLAEEKMPFYSPRYDAESRKVLDKILKSGNFGFYDSRQTERPARYWMGKIHSFAHVHKQLGGILPLFPGDVVSYYFFFLKNGVAQLMFDTSRKRRTV